MTLGNYPSQVSKENLLKFPNWTKEEKDFPAFKEIASFLGIAEKWII